MKAKEQPKKTVRVPKTAKSKGLRAVMVYLPVDVWDRVKHEADSNLRSLTRQCEAMIRERLHPGK